MKQLLFLTSTNLASNPRLVKELQLALTQGYKASVVEFRLGNWSDSMTDELKLQFAGVKFTELSALRKPFLPWFMSTVTQKICSFLPLDMMNTEMLSAVAGKRSVLLLQHLKTVRENYDWIIAHNPAAFYPAYWYAKKTGAALGIDVEDYHPGETNDVKAGTIMKKLMQRVLPFASYCSYAAPLIAAEVKKDIPKMNNQQLSILNGFDANEFLEPVDHGRTALQLVWFSQNIDAGRGLEHIIPVVNELYPEVELHLIGNLKQDFDQHFLQNKTGIHIHRPMPQKELHQFLADCDVGLATDIPVNRNRDIALTNKIIAYAQAGLFIVAFNTEAQKDFLLNNNLESRIVINTEGEISKVLLDIKNEDITNGKQNRFNKGKAFGWHQLSEPLMQVWNQ